MGVTRHQWALFTHSLLPGFVSCIYSTSQELYSIGLFSFLVFYFYLFHFFFNLTVFTVLYGALQISKRYDHFDTLSRGIETSRDLAIRSKHYSDVIMGATASQITSVSVVYSTVCSGADERKYQSSASLAFVRGIHRWSVNSPHKGPVTRKMFPFDDVIMTHKNNKLWTMDIIPVMYCMSMFSNTRRNVDCDAMRNEDICIIKWIYLFRL